MQINICQSAYIHLCNISWLHTFLTGSNTAFLARALVTCQITYCNFILSGIRHKPLQTSSCSCSCCVITRTCSNILLPSYNNFIGFLYNATLFQDSARLHNLIHPSVSDLHTFPYSVLPPSLLSPPASELSPKLLLIFRTCLHHSHNIDSPHL